MEYLKQIQSRLRRISIAKVVDGLIIKHKKEVIKGVRGQWKKGFRPDGNIIGVYRSFIYRQDKISRNPTAGGNVDLVDTGALSKGLTLNRILEGVFTIFSTDDKAIAIASKYGLDVYGLSPEETNKFMDFIAVMAIEEIINKVYADA